MNIAILHCRHASDVCTGASCMRAFNDREANFQQYKNIDVKLCAFMDCGGCDCNRRSDSGFLEKIDRLKSMKIDKVHIGVCMYRDCREFSDIKKVLEENGFAYELGTHAI